MIKQGLSRLSALLLLLATGLLTVAHAQDADPVDVLPPSAAEAVANGLPERVNVADAVIVRRGVDSIFVDSEGRPRRALSDGNGDTNSTLNYQYYVYYYPSIDAEGKYIALSALAAFPYKKGDNDTDVAPNNLVIGCHVTITHNDECPSSYPDQGVSAKASDVGMLVGHASGINDKAYNRSLVILPDYIGYGLTKSKPHPYLYQELTARNVVDAVRYGIALFQADRNTDGSYRDFASTSWKSVAVGYSQGGSVAMAVHKFIETNNLSTELHFAGSVCGDGPYDPIATIRWYINKGKVYMPVVLPLILKGMIDANPYMKGHTINEYLTQKFLDTRIVNMIASKTCTTDNITDSLLTWSRKGYNDFRMYNKSDKEYGMFDDKDYTYAKVSDVLTPMAINYFSNANNFSSLTATQMTPTTRGIYEDLHKALESNDLTVGWKPWHRMVIFHSYGDEVVPYVNAQSALNRFGTSTYIHHVRYTDSESDMKHVPVGTTFYFKLIGTSPEDEAVTKVLGSYSDWVDYTNDSWAD